PRRRVPRAVSGWPAAARAATWPARESRPAARGPRRGWRRRRARRLRPDTAVLRTGRWACATARRATCFPQQGRGAEEFAGHRTSTALAARGRGRVQGARFRGVRPLCGTIALGRVRAPWLTRVTRPTIRLKPLSRKRRPHDRTRRTTPSLD